jgi:hypothetical protein
MEKIERKFVDWVRTGKKLQTLREYNVDFIRYACYVCHYDQANCDGECGSCNFDGDLDRRITREELAKVFSTTATVINNWEDGRTPVPLEDLLLYCRISNKKLEDIIVFEK